MQEVVGHIRGYEGMYAESLVLANENEMAIEGIG